MAAIALALFILLFGFNSEIMQKMPYVNLEVALFASFLFGIIIGWKTNR